MKILNVIGPRADPWGTPIYYIAKRTVAKAKFKPVHNSVELH